MELIHRQLLQDRRNYSDYEHKIGNNHKCRRKAIQNIAIRCMNSDIHPNSRIASIATLNSNPEFRGYATGIGSHPSPKYSIKMIIKEEIERAGTTTVRGPDAYRLSLVR